MAPDLRLFRSKSEKIGAQRPAFANGNHSKKDYSSGSLAINEVVLGRWVNKGKKQRGQGRSCPERTYEYYYLPETDNCI
jgi:hypothetical protein